MNCAGEPFEWVHKLIINLMRYYMFYCNLYGSLKGVLVDIILTFGLLSCYYMLAVLCMGLLNSLYEFQTCVIFNNLMVY